MTYQVTARKWRPSKFSEVVGQEHITKTLINSIKNDRIAHAYLFTGPRGVGKTTTARILAKTLNCLNRKDAEPCNQCEMCLSIQNTQSLDIIEIDGASNRGIDEVRSLRESVKYAPTKGKYKVYIIDEVHMLTKESFNAFLKTLEEPPAHTIFIFATTDVQKVPLTIISRCQRFDFRRIQLDAIKNQLKKIAAEEKIKIDDKTLSIIARKADGALRDAQSYFDQVIAFSAGNIDAEMVSKILNLIDEEIFFRVTNAVIDKDFKAVFEVSSAIYENGWSFTDFIGGLVEHFRNILSVSTTGIADLIETADEYKNQYLKIADKFSVSDLLRILNFLNQAQQEMRYAQNHKLKTEIILSHLIGIEKTATITEIISNLNNNDKKNPSGYVAEGKSSFKFTTKSIPGKKLEEKKSGSSDNISTHSPVNITAEGVLNFDMIVEKWEDFLNSVSSSRPFLLGSVISELKPVELKGNKLNVFVSDPENCNTITIHEDYFTKKAKEYFGRTLNFSFVNSLPDYSNNKSENTKRSKTITKSSQKPEDVYAKKIIEELGGREIK
ncbi:MAG: DNA polymerase III subunit gamma/tau [Ignavibacteriaceae bacterium]